MKKYLIVRKYLVEAECFSDAEDSYSVDNCIYHRCVEVEGDIDVTD